MTDWTDTELDRMLARAERLDVEAKPAHEAHKMARAAYRLGKPEPIAPHSVETALNGLAFLLAVGALMLAFAGLIAWAQS